MGRNVNEKDERQVDKFKEAARELETDDDEARFDEKLRRIAKPPQKKEEKDG